MTPSRTYRAHHASVMLSETKLLPGVADTIPELAARDTSWACVATSASEFTLITGRAALGWAITSRAHAGTQTTSGSGPKPDPAMLLEGLNRLKVSTREAVFVGDMVRGRANREGRRRSGVVGTAGQ